MNIIESIKDPQLFGSAFKNLDSWNTWAVVLSAMFGLPLDPAQEAVFKKLAGGRDTPKRQVEECWIVAGRRSGKSRIAATVATFLAAFKDYSASLAVGERGSVVVLAVDKKQARTVFRYCLGLIEGTPMLANLIERTDQETIALSNRVDLEICTNDFRSLRGRTICAAVLDETAFWRNEYSATPDTETLHALRPSLATVEGALILGIGSPYRKVGVQFDAFRKFYGTNSPDVLVIKAASQTMNPTLRDSVIEKALEVDPVAARSEWFAEFRSDLASLFDLELIERAVSAGVRERPPVNGVIYQAFADPSGGRSDSFTMAIAHQDKDRYIIDAIRGIRPPFSPEAVVKEFSALLKEYRCLTLVGDRYSGEWVVEALAKEGVFYKHSDLSKSECYLESLPLFSQGVVDLLDYQPLLLELQALERRTSRSGKDSVDHPPNGRDDHANACCGVLAMLASRTSAAPWRFNFVTGEILEEVESDETKLLRREAFLTGVPVETIRARFSEE